MADEPTAITDSNDGSLTEITASQRIMRQLDHIDEGVHMLLHVLEEYRPLLDRARVLADPGSALRGRLRGTARKTQQ
jgi:hypothetical protein